MKRRLFFIASSALALSSCVTKYKSKWETNRKRAFIIHGWGATPADHWFRWLSGSLKTRGYTVAVPQLPNPAAPIFSDWQRTLARHIGTPQSDDLFVAHSLGNITLLHYLMQTRPSKIDGLIMVSAFADKLPKLPEVK